MKAISHIVVAIALPTVGSNLAWADDPPALAVRALVSTAGPYGESWDLSVTPDGSATLQVLYMLKPSGSLLARFRLSEDDMTAIRTTLARERFSDLPPELKPETMEFHKPSLRLDAWLGPTHDHVTLYDPKQLGNDLGVVRFLRVWDAVFESLPLKPKW